MVNNEKDMELDTIKYPITPDTNQDIQTKSLRYNETVYISNYRSYCN